MTGGCTANSGLRGSAPVSHPMSTNLHATCVAFAGRGILITGPSGAGKSGLGLRLIGLGATLIADDLTPISRQGGALFAHAPPHMKGVIEARGIGLLNVASQPKARLVLLVDLSRTESERLPHNHVSDLLGLSIDTIYKVDAAHFPAAIKALAIGGRKA